MANEENLKKGNPTTQYRSGREAVENGKKGGIASGKARRRKKQLKDTVNMLLALPLKEGQLDRLTNLQSIGGKNVTVEEAMVLKQIQKAMKGDINSFKSVIEISARDREEEKKETEKENKIYRIDPLVIADEFSSVRRDVLSGRHTEYVLPGGRGSTKSSYVSVQGIEILKNNPQMHMLVLRQVGNTLRDSVYNQILWAIDTLDLNGEFDCKVSPLEITYKKTGQKIYFRGADDPMKIKSIKVPFGYIGVLWFEELDQFRGPEAVRNIEQSAVRGGDKAYIFKSFNPPKTANNWANKYIEIPKESRLVKHSTYETVPQEWLGKVFLEEAEFLKSVNPNAYEHEYLGVANGTGGAVFDNVICKEISDGDIKAFERIYRGVDWGWFPDPFHYSAMAYDPARLTLYIFDEYRCNKKSNRQTADELLARGVTENDIIICDSAEQKSVGDYRSFGLAARAVEKGPGSVDYSMKWLQSLRQIVIDPVRCPATAKEFLEYEYDKDKDGAVISGYPDKDNHAIDSVRYAMWLVWRKKGR